MDKRKWEVVITTTTEILKAVACTIATEGEWLRVFFSVVDNNFDPTNICEIHLLLDKILIGHFVTPFDETDPLPKFVYDRGKGVLTFAERHAVIEDICQRVVRNPYFWRKSRTMSKMKSCSDLG